MANDRDKKLDELAEKLAEGIAERIEKYGPQLSVTQRVKGVKQPWGGYLKRVDFEKNSLGPGMETLYEHENVHATLIGLAVDYLSRFMMGSPIEEAFKISFLGAKLKNKTRTANNLKKKIQGLNDESIISALKLVGFDVVYRNGGFGYQPVNKIRPNEQTVENVRTMVERTMNFFENYGPVTLAGFTFEGAYTKIISSGDGDFLTKDTLWDMKVLKGYIKKDNTLQLLVYWRMGLRTDHPEFESIKYLGIYNPRQNIVLRYPIEEIPNETIKIVDDEVIGYPSWAGVQGMKVLRNFEHELTEFLESDNQRALVTGLDDRSKIRTVFRLVAKRFKTGAIITPNVDTVASFINDAFDKAILPEKVTVEGKYTNDQENGKFIRFVEFPNSGEVEEDLDFIIFYPVDLTSLEKKDELLSDLITSIQHAKVTKVIVVTQNDSYSMMPIFEDISDIKIEFDIAMDNFELV